MPQIPTPTPKCVESVRSRWHENEKFQEQEKAIKLLYWDHFPRHDNLAEVIVKVTVLNAIYSTNVYYRFELAKRIVELNPAERLVAGDTTLVNELAAVQVGEKTHHYYSFATKYCSQHEPKKFPIYDSLASNVLCHFASKDKFSDFQAKDLKNYPRYVAVIKEFQKYYGLEQFSLRWIDRYLWFTGKDAFGRKGKATS